MGIREELLEAARHAICVNWRNDQYTIAEAAVDAVLKRLQDTTPEMRQAGYAEMVRGGRYRAPERRAHYVLRAMLEPLGKRG